MQEKAQKIQDWGQLTALTGNRPLLIQKVRLADSEISIQGEFQPPPLANLSMDDQIFVGAFVQSHGSIKEMEKLFGMSYPTVKNRLNRISQALGFLRAQQGTGPSDVLDRLDKGELNVAQALEALDQK